MVSKKTIILTLLHSLYVSLLSSMEITILQKKTSNEEFAKITEPWNNFNPQNQLKLKPEIYQLLQNRFKQEILIVSENKQKIQKFQEFKKRKTIEKQDKMLQLKEAESKNTNQKREFYRSCSPKLSIPEYNLLIKTLCSKYGVNGKLALIKQLKDKKGNTSEMVNQKYSFYFNRNTEKIFFNPFYK